MNDELSRFNSSPAATPPQPPPEKERSPRTAHRQPRLTTAICALALALLVAVAVIVTSPAANKTAASAIRVLRVAPATPSPVLFTVKTTPTPERISAAVKISQYTALQPGDDYPAVQELQSQLSALGYLEADEPDTVYSAALADAVSLFQRAHGLEVNGEADAALQEKLFDDQALAYQVSKDDTGDDVAALQTALAQLGYFSGKPTGYFGAATQDALLLFQQSNGLAADGVFDADDRERLYSPQAKPADKAPAAASAAPPSTQRPAEKTPAPQQTPVPARTAAPSPTVTALPPTPELPVLPALDSRPAPVLEETTAGVPVLQPVLPQETAAESAATPESAMPEEAGSDAEKPADSSRHDGVEGVIRTALAQVGKPYSRGKEGPNSYDCSGLVYYCLTNNGVDIGRYSAASYSKVSDWKKISSMSALKRGDLIFYHDDDSSRVSHVGICLGDGTMIDASSNKSQIVHRSHTSAYWNRNFVCGRRVF